MEVQSYKMYLTLIFFSCFESSIDYLFVMLLTRENRYGCGMREEVDDTGTVRSYSGSSMDDHSLQPSLAHLKQRNCSILESGYPFLKLTDTDFNCEMPLKMEREDKPQKVMHHFLDECPKDKVSWLDSGDDKSSNYGPFSTTHLSISMPNSSHDFFMAHNGM